MTETTVKHKAYRICTDAANALWDKISFWTHGSDVTFDDGSTAEDVKALAENSVSWDDVTDSNIDSSNNIPSSAALHAVYEELSEDAGIIPKTQEEYDDLPSSEKQDPKKFYCITDQTLSGAPLDDNSISNGKVWSAQKINNELTSVNGDITNINGEITDIQGDISTLNSALTNRNVRCSNEYTFTASGTAASVNVSTFTVPVGAILMGATITQKTSGGTDGRATLNTDGANVALLSLTSGKVYGVRLLYIMGDV